MEGLPEQLGKAAKRHSLRLVACPEFPWASETEGPRCLIIRWQDGQAVCRESSAAERPLNATLTEDDWGAPKKLFLVCTHGSRDSCCGLKGVPIFRSLTQAGERTTLQVSHLGGHRFAPVIAAFPEWRFFGHVNPLEAHEMAQALNSGQPFLKGYRGLGRLSKAAQAVEAQLWGKHGSRLVRVEELETHKDNISVRAHLKDGETISYRAELKYFSYQAYKSCKAFRKDKLSELKLPLVENLKALQAF